MDPTTSCSLAALLSSLLSQTLLLLLLLSPSPSSPLSLPTATPTRKRKHLSSSPSPSPPSSSSSSSLLSPSPSPSPDDFPLRFRMSSSSFQWLSGLLEPLLEPSPSPSSSSHPHLPASSLLALGLSRLALGASYTSLARAFRVPEPLARSSSRRLCRVLCTNFRFWLSFPSPPSPLPTLPFCCGALASSTLPSSVSLLLAADPTFRILSLTATSKKARSWTGLRSSSLRRDVEDGKLLGPGLYLVAGDGFPLLPWVMVRFPHAEKGSREEAFNEAHGRMMRPAWRTVSSLKGWGVLRREVADEEKRMGVACVGTCAILHNMLLMREDYNALVSEDDGECDEEGSGGWCGEDGRLGEGKAAEEAVEFRRVLAEKAKELWDSSQSDGRRQ